MHNIKGFIAICDEAQRLGWPEAYQNDLYVIDRDYLLNKDNAPNTFFWGIRSTGTDIFCPGDEQSLNWARACIKHRSNEFYYSYNGQRLEQISPQDFIEQMEASCVKKLLENYIVGGNIGDE